MIQLFINDILVDLTEDIDISLTYQMNDFSDPQAVKDSYSKTVELYGTKTNNKIFGHIFNLDKEVINGDGLIGATFNPNLRVPYHIAKDGDIIDRGYMHLDEITSTNGVIKYSITLYGTIGDFFYNLMYDENDEEKNLSSIYYGINNLSTQDENTKPLFEYDLDFVDKCWKQRCGKTNLPENSMYNIFCPVPTHSGYYDNFSSDKVLYNVTSLTTDEKQYIPEKLEEDGNEYTPYKGYMLCETPRELEEYEIGDLRSHNQRLGMRLRTIYDAIKNPDNNGGYEVDDSYLNNEAKKYLNDAYIVFNRFNYEDINNSSDIKSINIELSKNPLVFRDLTGDKAQSNTYDISEYLNPHFSLYIVPQIKIDNTSMTGQTIITEHVYRGILIIDDYWWFGSTIVGAIWQCYYVKFKQGDTVLSVSDVYTQSSRQKEMSQEISNVIDNLLFEKIFTRVPELNRDRKRIIKHNYEFVQNTSLEVDIKGTQFVTETPIGIIGSIPKECDNIEVISFSVEEAFAYMKGVNHWKGDDIVYRSDNTFGINDVAYSWVDGDSNKYTTFTSYGYIGSTDEYTTAIYDGSVEDSSNRHVLTKKMLFSETKSPFDYLISLGKTLNWVFVPSLYEKKIYIYSKDKYYIGDTVEISQNIDRGEYTITPSTIEYNSYKINIPTPETYYSNLFKKKNNRIYGQFVYKPKYQFSTETNSILEETIYTLAVPYTMHSVYFTNQETRIPTPALGSNIIVTAWREENGELNTLEKKLSGALIKDPNKVAETNESFPKLCCFDAENSSVTDFDNLIVLFNGYEELNATGKKKMYLSNDFKLINQLADENCYVYNPNGTSITSMTSSATEEVTRRITVLPKFDVSNDEISLLSNEEENKTNRNLYNTFFRNDVEQFYNKSSKVLQVKYHLIEQPLNAMRRYYLIDNALWVLNKITDYKPNKEDFTVCEFVRIQDNNYCIPDL